MLGKTRNGGESILNNQRHYSITEVTTGCQVNSYSPTYVYTNVNENGHDSYAQCAREGKRSSPNDLPKRITRLESKSSRFWTNWKAASASRYNPASVGLPLVNQKIKLKELEWDPIPSWHVKALHSLNSPRIVHTLDTLPLKCCTLSYCTVDVHSPIYHSSEYDRNEILQILIRIQQ